MSTSNLGGLVQGISTTVSDYADRAVRTSEWQSIANNWNHIADERSRVLVCWAQRSSTTGGAANTKAANAWTRLISFGPMPLLVGIDGRPYPVRVAIGGRSIAAAKLRIGVCPLGFAETAMAFPTVLGNVIETVSFNNATNLWRADGVVQANNVTADYPIVNAVSSGTPSSVAAVLVTVEVWGNAAASSVWATQAYAAEQVAL